MLKDKLSKLRKEKKLTQYEAAEKLNISRGKLANYEQGSRQPDYEMLKEIANFYNVTTDYLLGKTDNPNLTKDDELQAIRNDPKLNLMFDNWKGMSEEERERALQFVNFLIQEREKDN